MLATEIKGNSIRVKIMLYFFALTVGFLSQITSVMSQSVSVDYCVLEKLGSAPNVPSTLLGKAPSTNNIKNCATKIKRKPPYGANTQLYLSRPDKTSRNKTQRAPRFPIIKNGQFIPPAGQIGLTALNKQQDLSLLSPPARKDELTPRKRVSQFSKYAAANKKILNAKVPVRKIKTPSAISKLKKSLPNSKAETPEKVLRKKESKKTLNTAGPAAPQVPNAPMVDKQEKNLAKFVQIPVSKKLDKKTPIAIAALEPNTSETESIRQIRFAFGSAKIETDSEVSLKAVSKKLISDPALRIQLMAYASIDGKSESQARRLSLSRALAVRSRLIGAGIKSTRIDVRALGSRVNEGKANRVDLLLKKR